MAEWHISFSQRIGFARQQRHGDALAAIKGAEERMRALKRRLKEKQFELELKLVLKRYGPEDESAEARRLLAQSALELAGLEAIARPDAEQKKKINALKRDRKVLQERIDGLARLADQVGGVISEAEARALILRTDYRP